MVSAKSFRHKQKPVFFSLSTIFGPLSPRRAGIGQVPTNHEKSRIATFKTKGAKSWFGGSGTDATNTLNVTYWNWMRPGQISKKHKWDHFISKDHFQFFRLCKKDCVLVYVWYMYKCIYPTRGWSRLGWSRSRLK